MPETKKLHFALEKLYQRYNRFSLIGDDPLAFVYRYDDPQDREVVGLLSAILAYGRVRQIGTSLTKLLEIMGQSPYEYIRNVRARKKDPRLLRFRHRFTSGRDLFELFCVLDEIYRQYPNLEAFFLSGQPKAPNAIQALTAFSEGFYDRYRHIFNANPARGFCYLISSPLKKSVCKRLMLFLRWMVRNDDVDPGLWNHIDPKWLIIPLDTHMIRLTQLLGLHNAKTVTLSTAVEVTRQFAKICPEDPVKYDFALSRIGIVEQCTGKENDYCPQCGLGGLCKNTGKTPKG